MKNIKLIEKALTELFGVAYKHDSKETCTFHPTKRNGHCDCQVFTEKEYNAEYEEIFSKIDPAMIDVLSIKGLTYYSVYQG